MKKASKRLPRSAQGAVEAPPIVLKRVTEGPGKGLLRGEFKAMFDSDAIIQESSNALCQSIWLLPRYGEGFLLSRAQVAALLPHLRRFVKTGKLG